MKNSVSPLPSLGRLLAALLLTGPALAQPVVPSWDLPPAELLAEMRAGGRVLFFRHPATDFSENDARMKSHEDCGGQRNLIDKGRDDARKIGIAVRALAIPIGRVLASPFCRTIESAQLAFGRMEIFDEARYESAAEGPKRYADLRALLGASPGQANIVVVGHGLPFYTLTGMRLAEGEIAVVRPLGGRFEVEGRIKPGDWAALRAAAGN